MTAKARSAATRAQALDPQLADAEIALGKLAQEVDWDFRAAEHIGHVAEANRYPYRSAPFSRRFHMYCFRRMAVGTVVFTAACVTAREQPATINIAQEQQAIRAQRDAMMAAESARDMEKALSFYTEDAVVQSPNTPQIKGTTAIRAMYERSMPHAPPMEAKITEAVITVARSGDIAFESGTAETTIKLPTGNIVAPSKHLILWKKIAGTWYVAGQSWSGDRAPAPPPTK